MVRNTPAGDELLNACSSDQLSLSLVTIRSIVQSNPEAVRARDEKYEALPLHHACHNENLTLEVVQFLVKQWPESVQVKTQEVLPLHIVCTNGNVSLEVVQFLVEQWPDSIRQKTDSGCLPLHIACENENLSLEVVQFLASLWPESVEEKNDFGWLPLHIACHNHDVSLEVVQFLVAQWPESFQEKNDFGWLPLHIACHNDTVSLEVIQFLVTQWPESVQEKNDDGWLPLHYACYNKDDVSLEVVQFLVKQWPESVQVKDHDEELPLHNACCNKHVSLEVVQFLVAQRPESVNAKTKSGKLPVEFAGDKRVREFLEKVIAGRIDVTPPASGAGPPTEITAEVLIGTTPPSANRQGKASSEKDLSSDRSALQRVLQMEVKEPVELSSIYIKEIITNEELGKGFFGTVYRGIDKTMEHQFAIKVINRDILMQGTSQDIQKARMTFEKEQKILSHFHHPNIASLYAYSFSGDPRGDYYLIYELAEKRSLDRFWADELGRERLSSFTTRVKIAHDIFTAISFLHVGNENEGISSCFHRDIKSANIVLMADMTAKLIDCGLAKLVTDETSHGSTTVSMGSKGYICPAYASGEKGKFDASCDIFSFGVVLVELWTGKLQNHVCDGRPFNFESEYIYGKKGKKRSIRDDYDSAIWLKQALESHFQDFVALALECLERDPDDRPSGEDVMERLRQILRACMKDDMDEGQTPSQADYESGGDVTSGQLCVRCRLSPAITSPPESLCWFCNFFKRFREEVMADVAHAIQPVVQPVISKLDSLHSKVDATLPVLAHLDCRLNNAIPRLFILLPEELLQSGWKNPKSWIHSKVETTYYLYFICAHSYKAVSPPLKIKQSQVWVRQISPVFAVSLVLLQIATKAGTGIDLGFSVGLSEFAWSLQSIGRDKIKQILDEVVKMHSEHGDPDLLDRIRSQRLTDSDIRGLNGDSFDLVVEKARQQRGWRQKIVPVNAPGEIRTLWVSKEAADNPNNLYRRVAE